MGRILLAALLSLFLVPQSASAVAAEFVPGEVIVKIRGGATPQAVANIHADANAEDDDHLTDIRDSQIHRLRIRGNVVDAIRNLSGNTWVDYAEPNYILHA